MNLSRKLSTELVHSMGAEIDLHIDVGYPVVYNNEKLNSLARKKAEEFMGKENVEETEMRMGSKISDIIRSRYPVVFIG